MKVVLREDPEGKEFVAKMFRHGFNGSAIPEADVLRRLDHPRITKIRDGFVGGWFSCTVIVMDFIPGKTLNTISKQIRTQPQNEGFLPKEKVFDWLEQISELLAYVHSKKVIHRDLNFGNWIIFEN
jgi:serine/threonine-protein kinase